jgi:hypothetical protein
MASVFACLVPIGCASVQTQDMRPDVPMLPPAAVERLPQAAAVYFSEAFRNARPEVSFSYPGGTLIFRYALGDASVEIFRQALAAVFSNVVELAEAPDGAAMPPDVSVVIVPQPPKADLFLGAGSVTRSRQILDYPVTLLTSSAHTPTQITVEGTAKNEAKDRIVNAQKPLDESMMRSAAAALIVALLQAAPASAGATDSNMEAAASPTASGVVPLRLDAGLARDDGLERWVGECLAGVAVLPPSLAGEQPSADLRDALFPWLDPGVAPIDTDGVRVLLEQPVVRKRLSTLGVGRLVLFSVAELEGRKKDNMLCGAGYGGGGCFGFYESQTRYAVNIAIWDVDRRKALMTGSSKVVHRLGGVAIGLPIPFFSSNEAEACKQMQEYVGRALQP